MTKDNTQAEFQQGDLEISAEITETNFDEEHRISAEARVEIRRNGEKILTVDEDVVSGNLRPDEPDMEKKIIHNSKRWKPTEFNAPNKTVRSEWQNEDAAEWDSDDLAEELMDWIENAWDYDVLIEESDLVENGGEQDE